MQISRISNNQQTFNGTNIHKAKRKALYGITAACALFAATCEISYAKSANNGGYRSSYRTAATRPFGEKVKNFLLQAGGLLAIGGCLYSVKKADDDREEEKDEKFKENVKKLKEKQERSEIEIISEENRKSQRIKK